MSNWARKVRRNVERSNYIKRIFKAVAECPELFPPGKLTRLEVQHDDWCAFWRGDPCDCRPTIKIRKPAA